MQEDEKFNKDDFRRIKLSKDMTIPNHIYRILFTSGFDQDRIADLIQEFLNESFDMRLGLDNLFFKFIQSKVNLDIEQMDPSTSMNELNTITEKFGDDTKQSIIKACKKYHVEAMDFILDQVVIKNQTEFALAFEDYIIKKEPELKPWKNIIYNLYKSEIKS